MENCRDEGLAEAVRHDSDTKSMLRHASRAEANVGRGHMHKPEPEACGSEAHSLKPRLLDLDVATTPRTRTPVLKLWGVGCTGGFEVFGLRNLGPETINLT